MGFWDSLRKLWSSNPSDQVSYQGQLEDLQLHFKSYFHHFQLLLTGNNKTLELMSELEEALTERRAIDMEFVRSRCTRIATNVFQIIRHLDSIAPNRYSLLFEKFDEIKGQINQHLTLPEIYSEHPYILPFSEINQESSLQTGRKMATLAELGNILGLKIPQGFVITATAYDKFIKHNSLQLEINKTIQEAEQERQDKLYRLAEEIQMSIEVAEIPEDLEKVIQSELHKLEQEADSPTAVAMRSSALGEDLSGCSFAGQYKSKFDVTQESISSAYKAVIASKYSIQAMSYRQHYGIRDEDVAMCVGCMTIVEARAGGVVYSQNPLDPRDGTAIVYSVWGLPLKVVDGSSATDVFIVKRSAPFEITDEKIPNKPEQLLFSPDICKSRIHPTLELADKPSLSREQVVQLVKIVLEIEDHFQAPQDVEWALDKNGQFVLLQARELCLVDSSDSNFDLENQDTDEYEIVIQGGVTASKGVQAGEVFIAKKETDALDFPNGAVLVTAQALPYWATVMGKAAAVVTEQGGIAGHLASVAREFGVPALFGVPNAVQKLKRSSNIVTVDASQCKVYRGRIDALCRKVSLRLQNPIQTSPVYRALAGTTELIVPLNLINPDDTRFKPKYCQTLHDIIRFCHEKAVHEMFKFGTSHRFPGRTSRQLLCDVPMQFWIINLDDGLVDEASDPRYVRLEEIVSIPMLALWRGMMALTWEGPPPVNTRGFLDVLVGSTSNPALNPSVPSEFDVRNYFMISKNFVSLQSRFGYHLSTVEALVGARTQENYAIFHFKGGAASGERRERRAQLVAEVLEDSNFRTDRRKDSVQARLEGYEQSVMAESLGVLGYLLTHTRQLDMVMVDDDAIKQYKDKILGDLKKISLLSGL